MEQRYHATTHNRFYPDISNANKNITVDAKLISPPAYLLTPCSTVLLEKVTGSQLVKKFSAFYGTQRFITSLQVPTICPCPESDPFNPYPSSNFLKIHLNIILPSRPGSPKLSRFLMFPHQNPVYASSLPHTRYMPRPSHSSRFYHANNIW